MQAEEEEEGEEEALDLAAAPTAASFPRQRGTSTRLVDEISRRSRAASSQAGATEAQLPGDER